MSTTQNTLSFTIATAEQDDLNSWHTSLKTDDIDKAIETALKWDSFEGLEDCGMKVIMIVHSNTVGHSTQVDFRELAERRAAAVKHAAHHDRMIALYDRLATLGQ